MPFLSFSNLVLALYSYKVSKKVLIVLSNLNSRLLLMYLTNIAFNKCLGTTLLILILVSIQAAKLLLVTCLYNLLIIIAQKLIDKSFISLSAEVQQLKLLSLFILEHSIAFKIKFLQELSNVLTIKDQSVYVSRL